MEITQNDKDAVGINNENSIIFEDETIPSCSIQNNQSQNVDYLQSDVVDDYSQNDAVDNYSHGDSVGNNSQNENINIDSPPSNQMNITEKKWSNNGILCLIETYKIKKGEFVSAKSHITIWNEIAEILKMNNFNYDAKQCKWKFARLKTDYYKKKDNIKKTGAPPINFKYFDEFNDIFANDHNVSPVALASGRRKRPISRRELDQETITWANNLCSGQNQQENYQGADEEQVSDTFRNDADEELGETSRKKIKPRSHSAKLLEELREQREERNEQSEKKREIILKCHNENIEVYKEMMNKLIDKL